jgi:transcriptional regulator with XRE-family HTH domain
MTIEESNAVKFLEELAGGPLTLAGTLEAIREGEGMSQAEFARMLGLSRQHFCDIEKGRKAVSPERAAKFAGALGYSEAQFVRLALQGMVDAAGLKLTVSVEPTPRTRKRAA